MLRNGTVYGISPRMRFDLVINLMTLYAYRHRKIFVLGGGQQWRPLVHVYDVARAFTAVMDAPLEKVAGEVFNVGADGPQLPDGAHRPDGPRRAAVHRRRARARRPRPAQLPVAFDKIRDVLGFESRGRPYEGIVEIKQALERGTVDDGIRSRTVDYYRFLLEAEQTVREVSYDGAIF